MKKEHSKISVVARFAYIFATIVTIFAQMGAAPAALMDAATGHETSVSATAKLDGPNAAGTVVELKLNYTSDQRFEIEYDPSIFNYDTAEDRMTYADGNVSGWIDRDDIVSRPKVSGNEDLTLVPIYPEGGTKTVYFTLKKPIADAGAMFDFYWSTDTFLGLLGTAGPGELTGHSSFNFTPTPVKEVDKDDGGTSTTPDTSTQPSTDDTPVTLDTTGLKLSTTNGTTFKVNDEVDFQLDADVDGFPTDKYDDIEVGLTPTPNAANLEYDIDGTAALLKSKGYSALPVTNNDSYQQYNYISNSGKTLGIRVYTSGAVRIIWDKSATGTQQAFFAMTAKKTVASLTVTPEYLGHTADGVAPDLLGAGTPATLSIKDGEIDMATDKHYFQPQSVANDQNGNKYMFSTFPLFYMTQGEGADKLWSFVYNEKSADTPDRNGDLPLKFYRKAVLDGIAYPTATPSDSGAWGGPQSTTNEAPAWFENFNKLDANGEPVAGSMKKFQPNTTYTLNQIDPVAGDAGGFHRIMSAYLSKYYYMPDGVPTFHLDDNGNFVIDDPGDGDAIKGQWQTNGKTLTANMYKVKRIQVVDQNGDPVNGVTITMNNSNGGTNTTAKTSDLDNKGNLSGADTLNGTGDIVPAGYDATKAFYYPAGTQSFDDIKFDDSKYSAAEIKYDLALDKTTDELTLSNNTANVKLSDDKQTVIITVHKQTDADTAVNIKKVAADDDTKGLEKAEFKIEDESASDAKNFDSVISDVDGMAKAAEAATSTTATRLLHITEITPPDDYAIGNTEGYYAVWEKGKGFTKVGNYDGKGANPTTTTSTDGYASVAAGTLVIQDPKSVDQGGADSGITFRYVGVDNDGKTTGVDGIGGAALPSLDTNVNYKDSGLGFTGLGSVIYNTDDPTTLMKATDLSNTVNQLSAADGKAKVQQLWKLGGLPLTWTDAGVDTMLHNLGTAITTHVFPSNPQISYQLNGTLQRQRAAKGTDAYNYYSFGSRMAISNADGTLKVTNIGSTNDRDNLITAGSDNKSITATLIKVKHVALKDANGDPIQGATVQFSNLMNTTPTDANGEAELVPIDSTGKTTDFVYPKADQKLVKITASNGTELKVDANSSAAFRIDKAASDQLTTMSGNDNFAITAGTTNDKGQYVQLKTTTATTTIGIHKQSATEHSRSLQDATFKVWVTGQTEADGITTNAATDVNGNTTVTLPAPSSDGTYYIKETSPGYYYVKDKDGNVTRKVQYAKDDKTHSFTWQHGSGVTGIAAGDTTITTAPAEDTAHAGMLIFNDMPQGGGGGGTGSIDGGGNGGNGGTLNLVKGDATSATTPPDGATFAITETTPGTANTATANVTTVKGAMQYNLGAATLGERDFTIQELQQPTGYLIDKTVYQLRILKDGTMYLGSGATDIKSITSTSSSNAMAALAGTVVKLSDTPINLPQTAPLTLTKVDAANTSKTLSGAHFKGYVKGVKNVFTGQNIAVEQDLDLTTGIDGSVQIKYNVNTGTGRVIALVEDGAPAGYKANGNEYDIRVNADGTPAEVGRFDSKTGAAVFGTSSDDGVVSIQNGKVVFEDEVDPNAAAGTINIKKVDATDQTKGLDGAEFEIDRIFSPAKPTVLETLKAVKATGDGMLQAKLGDVTTNEGTFQIKETKAPDGYALDPNTYLFYWTKAKGVTMVGPTAEMKSTATIYPQPENGVGTLVFADTKAKTADFKILKKDSFGAAGLPGATFEISDLDEKKTYDVSKPTDGDGNVTIPVDVGDGSQRRFKIEEKTAPDGYDLADPLFVHWSADTGVTDVSKSQSGFSNIINGVSMVSDGIVMIQDQPLQTSKTATFKIKKTDLDGDRAQGIPGGEAAGYPHFTLRELTDGAGVVHTDGEYALPDAQLPKTGITDEIKTNESTADLHLVKVKEGVEPTGYVQDTNWYYVTVSAKDGIVGVSTKPEIVTDGTSNTDVVRIDDKDTLNFGDKKIAPTGGTITVKKTPLGDLNTGLAGAKFKIYQVQDESTDISKLPVPDPIVTDEGGLASLKVNVDSGMFVLSESSAPDGYVTDTGKYYFDWNNKTGVTAVWLAGTAHGQNVMYGSSTKQVAGIGDNGAFVLSNKKIEATPAAFKVKKTDAADPTKGVTGNATFTVTRLDADNRNTDEMYLFKTTDGETFSQALKDSALTAGNFSIVENTPPSGYKREGDTLYFSWTADKGVTAVGNKANSITAQSIVDSNGQQAMKVDNGVLNFSDTKDPNQSNVITIKKVDRDNSTKGLPGAKFTLTDMGNGSITTGGTVYNGLTDVTQADGTQQFTVAPTAAGEALRVFRVDEVQAPTDYLREKNPYYISWGAKTGVISVGDRVKQAQTANQTTAVANVVAGTGTTKNYLTFADAPDMYTIHTALRTATASENGTSVSGINVTLSNPTGLTGTAQTIQTHSDGNAVFKPQQIADALGLTTAQMTGAYDVKLAVDGGSKYTNPVNRIVRFTFAGGKATPGFMTFNDDSADTKISSPDALKQNDKMVLDHANDTDTLSGNLTALLRKDTLNAKAISDANVPGDGIDGASFELDFTLNGSAYTTTVTTKAGKNGRIALPDPNTLLNQTDKFGPNTAGMVTIKQTNAPAGYAQNNDSMTFSYSTGYGYLPLSDQQEDDGTPTVNALHKDGDIDSIKAALYFFGDSEITYYLTKQISALSLDLAPASMNFGNAKLYTGPQSLPLLAADAAGQATFNTKLFATTDPNYGKSTQTTETDNRVLAKVTQTGQYADGWRLKLGLGDLTSENFDAASQKGDTISGGAINFANFATIKRGDTVVNDQRPSGSSLSLGMGQTINTVDLNGKEAEAGTYDISWALSDISMSLPANVGQVDTNYQAPLSWEVTDAP